MSPFGHEDYGISQEREIVHAVTDLGELATRLGSPNAYNRSGNVALIDDFENGVTKWDFTIPFGGGSFALSQEGAKNGLFSGKIATTTAYPSIAQIRRGVGVLYLGKLGLEFSFASADSNIILDGYLYLYTGSTVYMAGFRLDINGAILYVLDQAGAWQVIDASLIHYQSSWVFHTAKIVADFVNAKYARLFVNQRAYTVTGYSFQANASGVAPHVEMILQARNPGAVAATGYLDDIILTQNEI